MIHVPIYILSALESQESIFKYLPPNGYHWQGLKSARVAQRIWLILTRPSPGEKPWLKSGRYTEAVSCIPLPEHFFSRKKRIGRQPRRELRQINYAWSWEIADIGSRVYSGSCVLEAMCVVPCKSVLIRVSTRSWLFLEQKEPFMPCHDFVPRFRWTVEYARYRARSCVSIFSKLWLIMDIRISTLKWFEILRPWRFQTVIFEYIYFRRFERLEMNSNR